MADEFETVEVEYSEDDILYYLEDEDGNEVGFVVEEDGREMECYYEGFDADDFQLVAEDVNLEVVELEVSEDDILYYLEDEDGNEVGFVVEEDGREVECYYEDGPGETPTSQEAPAPAQADEPKERGYLSKVAHIAGYHGNKARKRAEVEIDKVRGVAEKGVDRATEAVESGGQKLKAKRDESDLGITREGVHQATEDLNVIAKEGAATMKELKGTYDSIMDDFGFLVPKKIKRRLP